MKIIDLTEKYEYIEAKKVAPDDIQDQIEKFDSLSDEEKSRTPLLYYILNSGTPDYKMSKEDAHYTDNSKIEGQHCGNCKFAYKKISTEKIICSQISGGIKLSGWCHLWKPAEK